MTEVNVRRRRPRVDRNRKIKEALLNLLMKGLGETLKAKLTRAVAIGAVGGVAQYAAAPVPDNQAPKPMVEISAPIPARIDADSYPLKLEPDPNPAKK